MCELFFSGNALAPRTRYGFLSNGLLLTRYPYQDTRIRGLWKQPLLSLRVSALFAARPKVNSGQHRLKSCGPLLRKAANNGQDRNSDHCFNSLAASFPRGIWVIRSRLACFRCSQPRIQIEGDLGTTEGVVSDESSQHGGGRSYGRGRLSERAEIPTPLCAPPSSTIYSGDSFGGPWRTRLRLDPVAASSSCSLSRTAWGE